MDTEPHIIVIGGANLDVRAKASGTALGGTSNPGQVAFKPGGVARNIADGLARLGGRISLISVVGADAAGDRILSETAAAGVDMAMVRCDPNVATGCYCAVLDGGGELAVAVSDMAATDGLDPASLAQWDGGLAKARLIVADCNLPQASLVWLMRHATKLVIDPVSVAKSRRLMAVLDPARPILAATPNRDEASAMTGQDDPAEAARRLSAKGCQAVVINLGADGAIAMESGGALFHVASMARAAAIAGDVTGAGDATVAGLVFALAEGLRLPAAVRWAQAAAGLRLMGQELTRQGLLSLAGRVMETQP